MRATRAVGVVVLLCGVVAASAGGDWAVAVFPSGAEFVLEVAADPPSRARGYMERERIAPDEGMLFVFERPGHHGFWMANCEVSLDIIWLDEAFRVVHVAPSQPPCPDEGPCPTITPLRAAHYVLEVAAGRAAEEGLQLGDTIYFRADSRR